MYKRFNLKQRMLLNTAVLTLVLIVILSALSIIFLSREYNSRINSMETDFDNNIKVAVQTIVGTLQANHQNYTDGLISKETEMETCWQSTQRWKPREPEATRGGALE